MKPGLFTGGTIFLSSNAGSTLTCHIIKKFKSQLNAKPTNDELILSKL